MRLIRAALAAGLLLASPAAIAQSASGDDPLRVLREAEADLRGLLQRLEDGTVPASAASSRLRQALNEVERAMLRLPAESRRGSPWQTAVKELSEAMAAVREEGTDPAAARQAAGEALATLPALRGEETGSGGS
ncbi:hypothetical protein [Falsiroseomonas sp. CW058]|uniref:hypothetical protein n=1 Tax=Falsiroseomonas sp. CW058 TaxID=3388664 RepID=UPI003D31E276